VVSLTMTTLYVCPSPWSSSAHEDSVMAWIMHLFIFRYGQYRQFLDHKCESGSFWRSNAGLMGISGSSWLYMIDNAARVPVSVRSPFI